MILVKDVGILFISKFYRNITTTNFIFTCIVIKISLAGNYFLLFDRCVTRLWWQLFPTYVQCVSCDISLKCVSRAWTIPLECLLPPPHPESCNHQDKHALAGHTLGFTRKHYQRFSSSYPFMVRGRWILWDLTLHNTDITIHNWDTWRRFWWECRRI